MKISTGLRPRVDQPTEYPKMTPPAFSFVLDEAPVRVPVMRAVTVWPVIFETAVDWEERPEGTIMSVMQFTERPKVTYCEVDLDLYDDFGDRLKDYVEHVLTRKNAPADAVHTRTRSEVRGCTHLHVAWWEVEA